MKKILAIVLAAAAVLSAAGCNRGENAVSSSRYSSAPYSSAQQTSVGSQSSDDSSSSELSLSVTANSSSTSTSTTSSDAAITQPESSASVDSSSSSSEPLKEATTSGTATSKQPVPEEHEHHYEAETFEPRCEEGGYTVNNCACGDAYIDKHTAPLGHSFTATEVEPPTCTAIGYTRYTCQRCGSQITADEIAAKGHSWGEWEITVEPTTSSEGEEVSICSECGEKQRRPIPKSEGASAYVSAVISLVNEEREKAGLSPLTESERLNEYAQLRSSELVDNFAHNRPDGSGPLDHVMGMDGIHRAGENIAMCYDSPEAVMDGWMNSTGHRENILKPEFTMIGVGCYEYNGRLYWTQIFAG